MKMNDMVTVRKSRDWRNNRMDVYISCAIVSRYTPAEARRFATALRKAADKAEKMIKANE